ncbi:MAG: DUF6438 domain-containing protein [Ignavibacteria bacterium]
MRISIAFLALMLTLLIMSCSSVSVPMKDAPEAYSIILERTACRGNCPVYSMTVFGDGTIEYEGYLNVPVKGKRIGTIPKDSILSLLNAIEKVNVNELQATYLKQGVTDMPSVLFKVIHTKNGIIRGKSITDYQGDDTAPEALRMLYNQMDAWYHLIQWQ